MTFMKLRWFIAQRAAVASVSSNAMHQAWWSQEEKITCSLKFFLATWRRFTGTTAFALAASRFHFHIRFHIFDHFITRESGWAGLAIFDPKVACEGGGREEGGDEDGQQILGLDSNPHLLCLLPRLEFRRKISQCRHPSWHALSCPLATGTWSPWCDLCRSSASLPPTTSCTTSSHSRRPEGCHNQRMWDVQWRGPWTSSRAVLG